MAEPVRGVAIRDLLAIGDWLKTAVRRTALRSIQRHERDQPTDSQGLVMGLTPVSPRKGTWLCLRAEIKQMLANGGGSIVNTSSVAGVVGVAGFPAYSASKGGVVQLTRTAALEYAPAGIRVNAVCPGATRTAMLTALVDKHPELAAGLPALHPMGRIAEPAEIAEAAVWLCSDATSFVTGQVLPVDGGWTTS